MLAPAFFQSQFYQHILGMIKQNSVMCSRSLILAAKPLKIAKNPAYKAAKAYYDGGKQPLNDAQAKDNIQRSLLG